MSRRLWRWRFAVAGWLAGKPIHNPWDLAQYDRWYTDSHGRTYILDGSQGHSSAKGFHHGPRVGCPVCADHPGLTNTADLPRRFRKLA